MVGMVSERGGLYKTDWQRSVHTDCIYVFCVDLRTNSDYFPIQH